MNSKPVECWGWKKPQRKEKIISSPFITCREKLRFEDPLSQTYVACRSARKEFRNEFPGGH